MPANKKSIAVKAFHGSTAEKAAERLQKFMLDKQSDHTYSRYSLRQMALAATPNGYELIAVFDTELI